MTEERQSSTENFSKGSLEIQSGFSLFLYRKTEKIVTALYLVTSLMLETEPVRLSLRQSAIGLLQNVFDLKDIRVSNTGLRNVITGSEKLRTLLAVSKTAGLISEMNAELINTELGNLREALEREYKNFSVATRIPESLFDIGQAIEDGADDGVRGWKYRNENMLQRTLGKSLSTTQREKSKGQKNTTQKVSDRKKDILRFVLKNGPVNVGNVTEALGSYSEKTIQRDLVSLVNGGLLKRSGERRWARYHKA